jgi:hypothetical protein
MNARRVFVAALCLLAVTGVSLSGGPALARQSPRIDEAERLSQEARRILSDVKFTEYSHETRVDEAQGKYCLDCSGLACYVLQREFPQHHKAIPLRKGQARARAIDFYRYFIKLPTAPPGRDGWLRIPALVDVRPGDILAWKAEDPKSGSTGHVVFVDSVPVRTEDGQIRLDVIDSTGHGHGSDTRKAGQTGIGRGTMWFTVDDAGKATGYRWSSSHGTLQQRAIAVGRVVEIVPR